MTTDAKVLTVAVLGGTGKEGSGLVLRWARSGYRVLIGSRAVDRAEAKATELNVILGDTVIRGLSNEAAAAEADLVVLSVPYDAHQAILESVKDVVQGKILVDATVPLVPPKVARVQLPAAGSAAKEAQDFLGEGVQVVSAFQNVAADLLQDETSRIECDVLADTTRASTEIILD